MPAPTPEVACAGRGNGSCASCEPARTDAPHPASGGDLKSSLYTALTELGCNFTADAVEASEVSDVNGELCFVTPIEFKLAMSDADLRKAALQALGKTLPDQGYSGNSAMTRAAACPKAKPVEDEVMQRAMADPAVQSFREAFPDAELRQVRNLKEG